MVPASVEDAIEILKGLRSSYESINVEFSDDVAYVVRQWTGISVTAICRTRR